MTRRRLGYDGVVLAAPVTVPYERFSTRSSHWFLGRAMRALVAETGFAKHAIDGMCVTSMSLAPDSAIGVVEHLGFEPRWVDNVTFGGASGLIALRRAARAVQVGDAEIVACVAGDTNQTDSFRRGTASFSQFGQDAVYPYGSGGPNASVALLTDNYMRTYGAEVADFGRVCVAQRANALGNPQALFSKPLTLDQYVNSPLIADPIRLYDCVMPCAGAEAFLVMHEETARAQGLPFARLLGAIERHNAFPDDPVQERGGWVVDRDELFAQAGVTHDAVDFVQAYDDYPVIIFLQVEDLGFCGKGEAKDFLAGHDLTASGSFPINTSGGQLSVGQAGGAGGFLGIVETIRQLTGQTVGTPVPDAGIGLVSGFGMINYDRGLSTGAALLAA
ncbi:thiolase family protein [Amorphus orientalis]|uniref:Acetyl-CoA acetyltransferase n=1 Tax=Amorphus orientalis TaxID=649198 RepID=A0AAE3VMW6_9HYPH|nr:thiolase family protein [Amorphus orientalis]MDQ0315444.1 acetyl-CoA acetyltransferase [Amorphus orientalis]